MHFRTERCQNYRLHQKIVQIKIVENEISYKEVSGCAYLPTPGVQLRAFKNRHVSNILLYWNGKVNALWAEHYRNYQLYQKMVQIKIVENEISYKKVSGHAHLPPTGAQLGASKNRYVSNILLYWNGKMQW